MQSGWRGECWAAVLGLAVATIAGLATHALETFLLLAVAAYLGWHLVNVWRLYRWLTEPGVSEFGGSWGLWEDVQYRLHRLQKRNRKNRQRLADILSEFRASTAALPDGAVVLDPSGQIVWCNDAAIGLLGLRIPQDMGQRVANLLRYPAFTEYMREARYESAVEAPSPVDSTAHLLLRVVPYGNNQRLLIVRDISELKRIEQMRRDFVANASHELRTPLTVLRGYLDMMADEDGQVTSLQEWEAPLKEMRQQSARMEQIINEMLALARLEGDGAAKRNQFVNVPDLIAKAVRQAESISRGRHHIETDIDVNLCLLGQPNELASVFSNLIYNAVQHTPSDSRLKISWQRNDQLLQFSVSDNGPGIPAKDIPRLTERFYRVDVRRSRAIGGTGLGLAIVKHSLERHGGKLDIASTLGRGSRFVAEFPIERLMVNDKAVITATESRHINVT